MCSQATRAATTGFGSMPVTRTERTPWSSRSGSVRPRRSISAGPSSRRATTYRKAARSVCGPSRWNMLSTPNMYGRSEGRRSLAGRSPNSPSRPRPKGSSSCGRRCATPISRHRTSFGYMSAPRRGPTTAPKPGTPAATRFTSFCPPPDSSSTKDTPPRRWPRPAPMPRGVWGRRLTSRWADSAAISSWDSTTAWITTAATTSP